MLSHGQDSGPGQARQTRALQTARLPLHCQQNSNGTVRVEPGARRVVQHRPRGTGLVSVRAGAVPNLQMLNCTHRCRITGMHLQVQDGAESPFCVGGTTSLGKGCRFMDMTEENMTRGR